MVKVYASNRKVKGSNFMGVVVCGQQWYVVNNGMLIEYSFIKFLE